MLGLGNSSSHSWQQCGGEDNSVQAFVLSSSSGLSSTYLLQVRFVLYAEMCVTGSGSKRHASQLMECKTLRLGHELTFPPFFVSAFLRCWPPSLGFNN